MYMHVYVYIHAHCACNQSSLYGQTLRLWDARGKERNTMVWDSKGRLQVLHFVA